jgi:hypothetical protein
MNRVHSFPSFGGGFPFMSAWRLVLTDDGVEHYVHEPSGMISWTKPEDYEPREPGARSCHEQKSAMFEATSDAPESKSAPDTATFDSLESWKATVSNLVAFVAKVSTETSLGTVDRCWVTLSNPVRDIWEVRHTESQGLEQGEVYYVNKTTGESVWEKPEGFDVAKAIGTSCDVMVFYGYPTTRLVSRRLW